MNADTSLLEFILNLLRDPEAQAEFQEDPQGMLAAHGLGGLCTQDMQELMPVVADHPSVDIQHGGGNDVNVTVQPPAPSPGQPEQEVVEQYLKYITNTYTYTDSHNTNIDNSVTQNVWASGEAKVDLETHVSNTNAVASGDGAVAAGDDINGTTTTGDGNAIGAGAAVGEGNITGDGNAVGQGTVAGDNNAVANGGGSTIGDDNTVANGENNVQGHGNVNGSVEGSQVGTNGGSASNDSSDHSVSDSGNTGITNFGGGATNTVGDQNTAGNTAGSHNSADSHNVADSGNTTQSYSDSSTNTAIEDSGNTDGSYNAAVDSHDNNSSEYDAQTSIHDNTAGNSYSEQHVDQTGVANSNASDAGVELAI